MKKGEVSSAFLIPIILTVAGFLIVFGFIFYGIDLEQLSEDQICELSVIARATAPTSAERLLPLKCTTKKLCLSQNGEDCPEFKGEEYAKFPLSKDDEKAAGEIDKQTADALLECWSKMGEGKLDLFGGGKDLGALRAIFPEATIEAKSTCVICQRIALSPDVMKKEKLLEKIDINKFMAENPAPHSSKSYIEIMSDSQVRSYPTEFKEDFKSKEANENVSQTNEIGIIFMQIETKEEPFEAGVEGATYTGAFILGSRSALGPFGKIVSLKTTVILAALTGAATGGVAILQTYRSRLVSQAYCGELTSVEEARKGCTITTAMDFKQVDKIIDLCSRLEGQP